MLHDRLNNSSSKEACWCIVGLNKTEKLLIGLVYRSPNSTEENNVLLNNMMSSLNDENFARIVVMGDFNYRDIDWSLWTSGAPEDHSSHGFIEAVRDGFMCQHVTFNTRFRENQSPSMLDLVFSSDELLVNSINQLSPLGKSDHVSIIFNIECTSQDNRSCITNYAYDRGNYEAMKDELPTVEWESEFREKSLNEKWTFMKDKIHSCVKTHVPERKNYSTKSKHKPLWLNRIAVKAVRKKTQVLEKVSRNT